MRILVTNDDGINAPGLEILREIAAKLSNDVWVVAPETNQSGASHSLTLHEPLRCRDIGPRTFAVRGTPTDCVIMGVRHILKDNPPALVLSGVNRGANLAEDVTYSGTIAAAFEGTLLGVRSIALSLAYGFDTSGGLKWETPLAYGPDIVRELFAAEWGEGVAINVNFPDRQPSEVAGTEVTRQGRRDQQLLHIDERADTWGTPYYWLGFQRRRSNPAAGTDLAAIYEDRISITPLFLNLTHTDTLESLAQRFPAKR